MLRVTLPPPRVYDPDDPAWPAPLRRAAVMVMLHRRDGEIDRASAGTATKETGALGARSFMIPMIVRGDDAPVHGGQTALPGGRWDPRDASMIATALREVEEEIGVPAARLEVLGELDDLPTRTGFLVRPVIATVGDCVYSPDPREVKEVFEVPLAMFRDHAAAEDLGVRELGTVSYPLRAYSWDGKRIWGVAARILEIVAELGASESP